MSAINEPGISKERVHDTLLPAITAYREKHFLGGKVEAKRDISLEGNPVTANPGSSDPARLVDDKSGTVWHGKNDRHSWFEIDLKKICFLDYIEMEWTSKRKPEKVEVKCKCGSGSETEVSADKALDKVPVQTNFI